MSPTDPNSLDWLLQTPAVTVSAFLWSVLLSRDFTPAAWIVAWILGLVVGIRRRAAWVALATLIGLDVAWRATGLYNNFVGFERQIASARYETILLIPFAIGIALLFQAFLAASTQWKIGLFAAFLVLSAATYRRPYEALLQPFAVDYEYQFLKQHASALPQGARLYVLESPIDDTGFIDAGFVGPFINSPVPFDRWSNLRCDNLSETYVYIGSSCAEVIDRPNRPLQPGYEEWIRECKLIRERLAPNRVEEIDVPARKMSWHELKDPTVRLGLYRLTDPAICALGPRPWPS